MSAARIEDLGNYDASHYQSPDDDQLKDFAKELHSVGDKKHAKDDYSARMEALVNDYLPKLSVEDRGRFLAEIKKDDKGALNSWLQGDRLDDLVKDKKVSADNEHGFYEAVADGYNQDLSGFRSGMAEKLFGLDKVDHDSAHHSSNPNTDLTKGDFSDNAKVEQRLMSGAADSKGNKSSEFGDFVTSYAKDYINKNPDSDHPYARTTITDTEAMLLNAADKSGDNGKNVYDIVSGIDGNDNRNNFLGAMATSFTGDDSIEKGGGLMSDAIKADPGFKDPMSLIIDSYANNADDQGAVDMAKFVYDHRRDQDQFYDSHTVPVKDRQDALSDLMEKKGGAIYDQLIVKDQSDPDVDKANDSMREFSNLMELTNLSPSNDQASAAGKQLNDTIADEKKDFIKDYEDNNSDKTAEGMTLGDTLASSTLALKQQVQDAQDNDAKNKEALMNIFGFLLDAISPLTDGVSSKISDTIKDNIIGATESVTGDKSKAEELGSHLYDMVTEKGTDAAKDYISDWIGNQVSDKQAKEYINNMKDSVDDFAENVVLSGLDDKQRSEVVHDARAQNLDPTSDA
jgi:hypothetical protein